jgi:hypothetical protein
LPGKAIDGDVEPVPFLAFHKMGLISIKSLCESKRLCACWLRY